MDRPADFRDELDAVIHLHARPAQAVEQYLETPGTICMCGAPIPEPDPADLCPRCRADLPRRRARYAASARRQVTDRSQGVAPRGEGAYVYDMAPTPDGQLSAHQRRRVAVEALCSDRTVQRYLDGENVAEMMRERIEAAMRKLGLADAVRAEAAS